MVDGLRHRDLGWIAAAYVVGALVLMAIAYRQLTAAIGAQGEQLKASYRLHRDDMPR
jgi:hypothetical protein